MGQPEGVGRAWRGKGAAAENHAAKSPDFSRAAMTDPTRFVLVDTSHPGNVGAAARDGHFVLVARFDQDLAELIFFGVGEPVLVLLVIALDLRVAHHDDPADFAIDHPHEQ